jgi:hypothetical protein
MDKAIVASNGMIETARPAPPPLAAGLKDKSSDVDFPLQKARAAVWLLDELRESNELDLEKMIQNKDGARDIREGLEAICFAALNEALEEIQEAAWS